MSGSAPPPLPHAASGSPAVRTTPSRQNASPRSAAVRTPQQPNPLAQTPQPQRGTGTAIDHVDEDDLVDIEDDGTPGPIPRLAVKEDTATPNTGVSQATPQRDLDTSAVATPGGIELQNLATPKVPPEEIEMASRVSLDGSNSRASMYSTVQAGAEAANLNAKDLFDTKLRTLVPEFDTRLQIKNSTSFLLAVISILVGIIQMELDFHHHTSTQVADIFRTVGSILTFLLLFRVLQYRIFLLRIERKQWNLESPLPLLQSGQMVPLICELLICALHPPPFVGYTRDIDPADVTRRGPEYVSDHLNLAMFLRLYLIGRVLRDFSDVYLARKRILQEKIQSQMGNEVNTFSWWLTTKYYFFTHSILSVVIPALVLVAVLSYSFYVTERFLQPDVFTFAGSIYHTFITMITVGYGDTTPTTHTGRALSVFAGLMGVVLSSFVVAVVAAQLAVTPPEEYACNWVIRNHIGTAEEHAAAALLQHVFRGWRGNFHHPTVEQLKNKSFFNRHRRWQTHMMNIQKRFRRLRMRESEIQTRFRRGNPVLEAIQELNKKVDTLTALNDASGLHAADLALLGGAGAGTAGAGGATGLSPGGARLLASSMGGERELAPLVGQGWFYYTPTDRNDSVGEYLCKLFTFERHDGYEALCKFLLAIGGAARERGIRLDFHSADYREVEIRLPIFTDTRPVMTPSLPLTQLVSKIEFHCKHNGGVPNVKPANAVQAQYVEYNTDGSRLRGSVRVGKARNLDLGVGNNK